MNKTMKKPVLAVLSVITVLLLTACGDPEAIDGKWVLVKQEFNDGTVIQGKDLSTYECYDIDGENAEFTSKNDYMGTKSLDMAVVTTGENEYQFKLTERLVFSTGTLEGKQLIFRYDDGTAYYFEKD